MNSQICFMYYYGPRLNCFRPFLSNNSISWRLQEYSDTTQVGTLLTEFCEELIQAGLIESYDISSIVGGSYLSQSYATINVVLKSSSSSDVPDYTQILTNINTNLTNLNDKFSYSGYTIADIIRKFFMSVVANCSLESLDINLQRNSVGTILQKILAALTGVYQAGSSSDNANVYSYIKQISQNLKQSVSPNSNITDVISALNATIDSKQETTIVNNDNTNLVQVEGVLDYRLKPQDSI